MKTVLVIGGGITGLSAIYELHKWKQDTGSEVSLVLAEASGELGGKISTVKQSGFIMESGADSMVTRKAISLPMIQELGLQEEIVYNATGRSFIYTDGELKPIPADAVFGIPTSVESLAKTALVSAEGKVEALKDFYVQNETFTKNDSIGDFLEYFFGKELVEKQIAPVLSGVYSGRLSDLTIASTLPYLLDYKEKYGSIIKGLEANKEKFQSSGKKFLSFKGGLGTLIDALASKLKEAEIRKHAQAERIEKINGRYHVSFTNGETLEADYIVLSIPHTAAEKLFDDQQLTRAFAPFKTSSLISIYAGFDVSDSLLPEDGTGFITADDPGLLCNACTWTSRKWTHTSANGNLLVRLFYKSSHPSFASLQSMEKSELLRLAMSDIRKALGLDLEPAVSEITNWSDSMPNYLITHPQTVEKLEKTLAAAYPGVLLAGCSYYGVGIPDCIENGEAVARQIIESF